MTQRLDIPILYEDSEILVIDKPAGLVVNRAESVTGGTVQDWTEDKFRSQISDLRSENESEQIFKQRSGIAHRLDKETSGCLVIAKDPDTLNDLLRQFKERQIKKEYSALVHGRVDPKEGGWKLPVGRSSRNRHQFQVRVTGKPAETSYWVNTYYTRRTNNEERVGEWLTLLTLIPKTGRTHQIRVHMAHYKHPLVADELYGGKRAQRDRLWCKRIFLHAHCIELTHPSTGEWVQVVSPLSVELQDVLAGLVEVHEQGS